MRWTAIGRHRQGVTPRLGAPDPDPHHLLRQRMGDALLRGERLVLVAVDRRHPAIFPVAPEPGGIAILGNVFRTIQEWISNEMTKPDSSSYNRRCLE